MESKIQISDSALTESAGKDVVKLRLQTGHRVRVARLQNKVGTKDLGGTNFPMRNAPKIPIFSGLNFVLVRVPLQKLVVKFFPEISPVLLSRVTGI